MTEGVQAVKERKRKGQESGNSRGVVLGCWE